jgi:hypothetical protein
VSTGKFNVVVDMFDAKLSRVLIYFTEIKKKIWLRPALGLNLSIKTLD